MPQQINLLTPILLAPKRYLSALTLLQVTALLLVLGVAAGLWMQRRERLAELDHQALLTQYTTQRQQLLVARANLPAPQDAAGQQQQLLALEAGNVQRKALLDSLGTEGGRKPGQRHSDLLALVARSLPETVWLGELRYAPGRIELVGGTLDTAVLRPWLGRLATHPLLAGQELSSLRVDRLGAPGADAAAHPLLERGHPVAQSNLPVWAFRVISTPAGAVQSAAGEQP